MPIYDPERYVCPACVGDALKAFIESEAASEECSFCGATPDEAIAAPLDELISYIESCISKEYEDPTNLGYCSLGETFNSHEILWEIDLELANDEGSLFSAISAGLSVRLWCRRDPYGMTRN